MAYERILRIFYIDDPYGSGKCLCFTSLARERCWGSWFCISWGWLDVSAPLPSAYSNYSKRETGHHSAFFASIHSHHPKHPIHPGPVGSPPRPTQSPSTSPYLPATPLSCLFPRLYSDLLFLSWPFQSICCIESELHFLFYN